MMWAYQLTAPMTFERRTVEAPAADALRDGEVLLRFLAGGICGSDVPRYKGDHGLKWSHGYTKLGYPMHEILGEVIATRSDLAVGRVVVGWSPGIAGLSEISVADATMLAPVTAPVEPPHGVVLQPLACVLNSIRRIPDVEGSRVALLGLGSIGSLFAYGLKAFGAAHVTAVDRVDRSIVADRFNVDDFVHQGAAEWAASLAPEEQFPIVIEAVGHQVGTLNAAIAAAAHEGFIFYFGIADDPYYPVAFNAFLRKDLTLCAGTTRERRAALEAADRFLAKHPDLAETYVTNVFPVSDAPKAYRAAATEDPGRLKVVVDGTGDAPW